MRQVVLLCCGFLLAGCTGSPTEPGQQLPFTTLWSNRHSRLDQKGGQLVSSQSEWKAAWRDIAASIPPPPAPAVDFATSQVIVVAAGMNPDSCWRLAIDSVTLGGTNAHVMATDARPGMSCTCTPDINRSVHVIQIPRVAETATFVIRKEIQARDCN
jgi:hypothetical protein